MATLTKDDLWKAFSVLMSALVIQLAAWVWNTNLKVAQLANDLGDAEDTISVLEKKIMGADDNSKQIIGMEKDIEYMKGSLSRIESLVTRKKD